MTKTILFEDEVNEKEFCHFREDAGCQSCCCGTVKCELCDDGLIHCDILNDHDFDDEDWTNLVHALRCDSCNFEFLNEEEDRELYG